MSDLLEKSNSRLLRENSDLQKALKDIVKAHTESGCKDIARRALGIAPRRSEREVSEVKQVVVKLNGDEWLVNLAEDMIWQIYEATKKD